MLLHSAAYNRTIKIVGYPTQLIIWLLCSVLSPELFNTVLGTNFGKAHNQLKDMQTVFISWRSLRSLVGSALVC